MSAMNRTDRLFAITVLLQSRARVRAADLAVTFGITKRTVYRDIAALSESGVPVVSLPGAGYELMEGFSLPPLQFTPAEASALFLGARLLARQAAGRLPANAEHAIAKIAAVLPDATRDQVERLTGAIGFIAPQARFDLDDARLVTLRQAIGERRLVFIRYHGLARDEVTEREVEPHGLTYSDGAWYLDGYCHLRRSIRAFRLTRVETLVLRDQRFASRPESKDDRRDQIEIRVRVAARALRWVRERQHWGFVAEDTLPGGDAVITYRVDTLIEIVPWLLAWGAAVEPLTPPQLRAAIRAEAHKLAEMLT